jgi:hypothetical protein
LAPLNVFTAPFFWNLSVPGRALHEAPRVPTSNVLLM